MEGEEGGRASERRRRREGGGAWTRHDEETYTTQPEYKVYLLLFALWHAFAELNCGRSFIKLFLYLMICRLLSKKINILYLFTTSATKTSERVERQRRERNRKVHLSKSGRDTRLLDSRHPPTHTLCLHAPRPLRARRRAAGTSGLQSVSPFSTAHLHSSPTAALRFTPTRTARLARSTCQGAPSSHSSPPPPTFQADPIETFPTQRRGFDHHPHAPSYIALSCLSAMPR